MPLADSLPHSLSIAALLLLLLQLTREAPEGGVKVMKATPFLEEGICTSLQQQQQLIGRRSEPWQHPPHAAEFLKDLADFCIRDIERQIAYISFGGIDLSAEHDERHLVTQRAVRRPYLRARTGRRGLRARRVRNNRA